MTDDEIHEKRAFLTHCGDRATTPHEEVIIDHGVALADEALQRGAAHQEAFAAQCESVGRIKELSHRLDTARGLLAEAARHAPRDLLDRIGVFLAGAPA